MKRFILIMMFVIFAVSSNAADAAVSVSVGEPGFYGRIDIGNAPPPEIIYPQPVVIAPPPGPVVVEPLYLHVPPGHEKNWRKHCKKYNACGRPVYFVRDRWYNDVYVPYHRKHHKKHDWEKHGKGHDKDKHWNDKGYYKEK